MTRGLDGFDAVGAVRKALEKAAERHNHLLCPHQSFDDGRLLNMFKSSRPWVEPPKSKINSNGLHRHTVGHFLGLQLGRDRPSGSTTALETLGATCEYCSSFNSSSSWGHQVTWHWIFRDKEDGGLYLKREFSLYVPDLKRYSPRNFDDWTQMLPPTSYGRLQGKELRHITWCPDKACANGKSTENHARVLSNVWHVLADNYVPPRSKARPVLRYFDNSARRVEDQCLYVKDLPELKKSLRLGKPATKNQICKWVIGITLFHMMLISCC